MQPTHIIRVLGDAIRRTRTNVRGVVTHANDSEEEKSEEGPCKEEGQEDEAQEEISCVDPINVVVTVLQRQEQPVNKAMAAAPLKGVAAEPFLAYRPPRN